MPIPDSPDFPCNFQVGKCAKDQRRLAPALGCLRNCPFDRGAFFSWSPFSSEGDAITRERRQQFFWEQQYAATVLETDEARLGLRVETLEATLFLRLLDLTGAPEDQEDSKAVEEALRNLSVLKHERGIA